jgi:hypothetical protein
VRSWHAQPQPNSLLPRHLVSPVEITISNRQESIPLTTQAPVDFTQDGVSHSTSRFPSLSKSSLRCLACLPLSLNRNFERLSVVTRSIGYHNTFESNLQAYLDRRGSKRVLQCPCSLSYCTQPTLNCTREFRSLGRRIFLRCLAEDVAHAVAAGHQSHSTSLRRVWLSMQLISTGHVGTCRPGRVWMIRAICYHMHKV